MPLSAPSILTGSNGYAASIAAAGDTNNDGYGDLIVGEAPFGGAGAVYVYPGGLAGVGSAAGMRISAPSVGGPSGEFGASVGGAGDVNRDGYDDVIVGAPGMSPSAGTAFVFAGSAGAISAAPIAIEMGSGGQYGGTTCMVGDVDGDGYADFSIGAALLGGGTGGVDVFSGSMPANPSWLLRPTSTNVNFGASIALAAHSWRGAAVFRQLPTERRFLL